MSRAPEGCYALLHGDVLAHLRTLPSCSAAGLLCDPPYGIGNHQPTGAELIAYLSGAELDTGGDFMGKAWFVPSVAMWREAFRVLKPGAPLMAFAGSRTGDLITLGLRAAGFEIRDTLMWMYGSGFPKSMDVAKAIDKTAGHWRGRAGAVTSENVAMSAQNYERTPKGDPITAAAAAWEGYGTALKPAYEPIILARKPLEGTMVDNVAKWGVGGLAIDASRIEYASDGDKAAAAAQRLCQTNEGARIGEYGLHGANAAASLAPYLAAQELGRWPANVILDEEAGFVLDAQSGNRPGMSGGGKHREDYPGGMFGKVDSKPEQARGDNGGASRFFKRVDTCEIANIASVRTTLATLLDAFARSGAAISEHPEGKLLSRLWRELSTAATQSGSALNEESNTQQILSIAQRFSLELQLISTYLTGLAMNADPSERTDITRIMGDLSTFASSAAAVISACTPPSLELGDQGFARFRYLPKVSKAERERGCGALPLKNAGAMVERTEGSAGALNPRAGAAPDGGARNFHPCCKPIALITYLARMILPPTPGAVLLVPYSGSGSEVAGALLAGWPAVIGIEREADYVTIANARIPANVPASRRVA